MEKLSSSSNSLIRNLSLDFYKEAYKWLGESLLLFTNNLKKNIKQDLEKFIEEWPKSTIMTPLILIDNEEFDPNNNKQKQQNNNNENDMFDILEGVDIFNKFNDNWCEKVLNQAKWNEKKELLDEFITAANVPKLQNSNYYPILSMVKKILNDSNINVMCCGIKILGILAKGLRKAFQSPARNFFPLLLSKFKDKKTFIIDETHKSLENFLFCLNSFDEVLEDFKEALHEKVLGLKFNLLIWFDKFLEKLLKSSQKSLTNIKTVGPLIKNVLDDGSAEVRDYASKILGKIKAVYGKDFIPGFFADIQLNKLQKIDDAEEKFKATSNFNEFKQNIVPLQKIGDNNNNKMKKKTNDKNEPNFKNKQKIEGNIKNSIEEENNSSFKLSLEASENLLKDNNFEFFLKSFETNSVWTEKNEAIKEIQRSYLQKLEENPLLIEAITLIIKNRFKEWKESNVNLVKEFYNLLIFLSNSKKNLISKRIANILISFFIEKMQDGNKYSELLWSFIINILNYTHPKQLILEFLMKIQEIYGNDIKKANAKTITELYGFFLKLIDLVSLQNLPLKEIIDLSKFLSTSPNPNIKQSVSNMLKCLYSHVGQQFTLFLKDMNPSLLKTLHNEFSKVKILDDHEKKPKIKIFEENEKVGVKKPLDLLDSLPRTDISNEVNNSILY